MSETRERSSSRLTRERDDDIAHCLCEGPFVAVNAETLKNANPEMDDRVQKAVRELLPQN